MASDSESWVFWAKTPDRFTRDDVDSDGLDVWLSLRQHLRDTADVGELLASSWVAPSLQKRLVQLAGDEESAVALVAWLAGTHDIGKAELHFSQQLLRRPDVEHLSLKVLQTFGMEGVFLDPLRREPHSVYSDLILGNWLREKFPESSWPTIASVSGIAGCHHGKPSRLRGSDRNENAPSQQWLRQHSDSWRDAWVEIIGDITERTGAHAVLDRVLAQGGVPVSDQFMLAGLVTMADWLSSNQEFFGLTSSGRHVSDSSRASEALARLGITRTWHAETSDVPPFRKRFGWSERTNLRPVQDSAVQAAASVSGPTLLIIEEEMGQGKTEAALLAAEMIAARTGAGGVAFALPTMATTDAMYTRLERWASSVTEGDTQNHSLFLGHSRSRLNPEYERLIRKTRSVDSGDSSVIAHQWFSGKKGLLAEFAVTTVDQILMAALATRYVTLRHLGLSGKVVIIDEAHSYDVYTSSYLERTLSWLAAQGVSVIVLSATLASGSREKLVAAYKSGLGLHLVPGCSKAGGADALQAKILAKKAARKQAARAAQNVDGEVPYPRLTIADQNGSRQRGIVQRGGHRKVALQFAPDDVETIIDGDGRWQSDGGVVGIVCNTVRRAQELYESLEARFGDDVELLHSQFTAADRAERELRLVTLLGPGSHRGTGRPEKRIVVGTQIIEQSLDIDFDVLISDMAPTDALMQRAGRLHRHQRPLSDRPNAFANPTLYIRGIEWKDDGPEFEGGSVAIYRERVLLGSLAVLHPFVGHEICLMHDLDSLVERTYSDALDVPLSWRDRYDAALAKETIEVLNSRQKAEQFQIKPPSSSLGGLSGALAVMLEADASRSETSASAHVRDIEPGIEVLLVMERDGYLSPLPWLIPDDIVLGESAVPPRGIAEVLASSVIRLPRWLVPPGPSIDRAIDELERNGVAAWQSDFRLKGQLLLRLNRHLEGELLGKYVRYDNEVGLRQIGEMQGTEVPADNEEGIEDSYYEDLDDGVWE